MKQIGSMLGGGERLGARTWVLALWVVSFLALPFVVLLKIVLAKAALAQPPFVALFEASGSFAWWHAGLQGVRLLLADPPYASAYRDALAAASITTGLCLLAGMALSLASARRPPRWRGWCVGGTLLLLGALLVLGCDTLAAATPYGVPLILVCTHLPVMVVVLYAVLVRQDPKLLLAAEDLGASLGQRVWRITLPLALPGMLAGSMLVFLGAFGQQLVPVLLAAGDGPTIRAALWGEFIARHWPVTAALVLVLSSLVISPFALLRSRV